MGTRIIIADDAAFVRRMIKTIVLQARCEVVAEAENGVQAVQTYMEHRPDAIIMDILMPEMDGIEATRQIRSEVPDAKVIICSAVAEPVVVKNAMSAGATDFVVKPVEPQRMIEALHRVAAGETEPRMGGEVDAGTDCS